MANAATDPPCDRHYLIAVVNLRKGRRPDTFQQHREPLVVALVQQDSSTSAPRRIRVRFMHVAGVRKRHLQHSGPLSPPSHRNDDPDTPVHHLAVRHAPPTLQQLLHDPRQFGEPRRSALSFTLDGAPRKRLWQPDHPGTLRAGSNTRPDGSRGVPQLLWRCLR